MFRYRVACAVDVYSDTAHLYWQFIGSGWDKPTQHAVITVHLPGHSGERRSGGPASAIRTRASSSTSGRRRSRAARCARSGTGR